MWNILILPYANGYGNFNSFLASGLLTLANSLGPDQDRLNDSPDLDPNRLTL